MKKKCAPVREITAAPISGVYLLYGIQNDQTKFYIGESSSITSRVDDHLPNWYHDVRSFVLREVTGERSERLRYENRFIIAARRLDLPLLNVKVRAFRSGLGLNDEISRLEHVLCLLGINQDTALAPTRSVDAFAQL